MIIPLPQDPKSWAARPITWALLLANFFIFFVFFFNIPEMSASTILSDGDLRSAGEVYLQYVKQLPTEELRKQPSWVLGMRSGDARQMDYLGSFAIRDVGFLDLVESGFGSGDELAIASMRTDLKIFRERLSSQPLHRFGLSSERTNSLSWLTYQFSHVGLLHLLSNMVFLFFIGLVVESAIGAMGLLCLYLGGGVAGALLFLWISPNSVIPMVGASGAVSAMMAFYALFEPRRYVRFYYIVAPFPNLHGYIYLPTLLILPLFLLADVTGLISAPDGLVSGVAYSAHVGGALFGFFWAIVLRFVLGLKPLPEEAVTSGVTTP